MTAHSTAPSPRPSSAITCGPVVGFAHAITPRRRPEDLVLPPAEHQMVLELAAAGRAWPRIAEGWGFAARGGAGGVKALFTGEPGTGKTLAAEVIAGMLGLTLLKIDLSQVVSKWVGETEKNLDTAFRQAEDSQALLFFDEADALFGKRGEVTNGMDRYANLEVGFLLQRLEQSQALVILASNLKENLDQAFTRRFHHIIHFPRPETPERERIWRLAFPAGGSPRRRCGLRRTGQPRHDRCQHHRRRPLRRTPGRRSSRYRNLDDPDNPRCPPAVSAGLPSAAAAGTRAVRQRYGGSGYGR